MFDETDDRLQDVGGLEPGNGAGDAVPVEKGSIGIQPDDDGDMARQNESVDADILYGHERVKGLRHRLVGGEH